jgi:hypothetical protein
MPFDHMRNFRCLGVPIFLFVVGTHSFAQSYSFVDLGAAGGTNAIRINDQAEVVGYARNSRGVDVPSLYSGSGWIDLEARGFLSVVSINNRGLVSGSLNQQGFTSAAVSGVGGAIRLNALSGYNQGIALSANDWIGVNGLGMIVGVISNFGNNATAVVWRGVGSEDRPTELPRSPGTTTEAKDVNNSGVIAGNSRWNHPGDQRTRATVWVSNTQLVLGSLGGPNSRVESINDLGQIVGESDTFDSKVASIWYPGSDYSYSLAPSALPMLPKGKSSYANDINDFSLVVGRTVLESGEARATLWSGGTAVDLNNFLDDYTIAAGWQLRVASGINNRGEIVGMAFNSQTRMFSPFLLSPVPEPASWLFFIFGIGLVSCFAASQRRYAIARPRLSNLRRAVSPTSHSS